MAFGVLKECNPVNSEKEIFMRMAYLALPVAMMMGLCLADCSTPNMGRSGRLLTMAGEEAGLITNLSDRLTRQLNIADLPIPMGPKGGGEKTCGVDERGGAFASCGE